MLSGFSSVSTAEKPGGVIPVRPGLLREDRGFSLRSAHEGIAARRVESSPSPAAGNLYPPKRTVRFTHGYPTPGGIPIPRTESRRWTKAGPGTALGFWQHFGPNDTGQSRFKLLSIIAIGTGNKSTFHATRRLLRCLSGLHKSLRSPALQSPKVVSRIRSLVVSQPRNRRYHYEGFRAVMQCPTPDEEFFPMSYTPSKTRLTGLLANLPEMAGFCLLRIKTRLPCPMTAGPCVTVPWCLILDGVVGFFQRFPP